MYRGDYKRALVDAAVPLFAAGAKRYFSGAGTSRTYGPKRRRYGVYTGGIKSILRKRRIVRRNYRRPAKRALTQKYVKKKLRKVCKFMKQQTATHTHRVRSTSAVGAGVNETATVAITDGGKLADIEAAMANLRFFVPGSNTIVTADISVGTYSRDCMVSIVRRLTVKNNYQVPVVLSIFSCTPKDATSVDAAAVFTAGLADQGNPSGLSNLIKFKDSKDLVNMWTCRKVCSKTLMPGKSCRYLSFAKEFQYNISTADVHSLTYQKNQGGHNWVIRLSGVLGHDSIINGEQGYLSSRVDVGVDTQYIFKYDAGKDLTDFSVADNSATFTNDGLVSNMPIADNQALSTA